MIRLICFDYDGVIVDSMSFHARAWQKIFAGYGIHIKEEDIYLQEGRPTRDVVRYLFEKHARPIDEKTATEIAREKEKRYISSHKATLFPEAVQLIHSLRQAPVALALVTGSPLRSVTAVLPDELLQAFDAVVTADDVEHGKPAPDPYLAAAERLRLAPEHGLVIENAPLGIRAARAAGMRVAAITTTLPEAALSEADWVVHDFQELRELLFQQMNLSEKKAANW